MTADRALDRLFDVSREQFIPKRNALVARLRDVGDAAAARAVARMRKPSVAVWAINQAARRDPAAVRRFIEAVAAWRTAYARERGDVREATRRQREALDRLVDAATAHLQAAAGAATPDATRRISGTVLAAAADRATADALRRGRLTEEHALTGFELMPGITARRSPRGTPATRPPSSASGGTTPEPARRADAAAARRQGVEGKRAAAAQARRAARDAERRQRALEREATRRRRAVEKAEREVAALRARLQRAEARAAQARRT